MVLPSTHAVSSTQERCQTRDFVHVDVGNRRLLQMSAPREIHRLLWLNRRDSRASHRDPDFNKRPVIPEVSGFKGRNIVGVNGFISFVIRPSKSAGDLPCQRPRSENCCPRWREREAWRDGVLLVLHVPPPKPSACAPMRHRTPSVTGEPSPAPNLDS